MQLPTLYKKTNTGKIQEWTIFVDKVQQKGEEPEIRIVTKYGQVGGKIQKTYDLISEGKNIGKANATNAHQQAEAEALAKWEKQKKNGYVESVKAAEAGELDDLIEGGILPMLAHTFEKQGHKIVYPALIQKKYDGTRMIAILKDGKCTLWSRTRKPIHSLPHLVQEIESNFSEDVILDGEAYNDKFKDNFEHIIHLVRQEEPDDECTDVQFHVYDMVNDKPFKERSETLSKLLDSYSTKYLVKADTFVVENEDQVTEYFELFREQRLEGAILRNSKGLYVNKRSADLIKIKEMDDAEFPIISVVEGRGKLAGHAIFVCKMEGQEFQVKMKGATEKLKEYFEDHSLWKGKLLTVQFQGFTAYGLPRFPVGLRIREEE